MLNLRIKVLGAAVCAVLAIGGVSAMKVLAPLTLEGDLQVPAVLDSIQGQRLEIRVFAHESARADRAAKQIGALDIKDFAHAKGTETRRHFTLKLDAKRDEAMRYYATFFILDGSRRTHMGGCAHRPGDLCSILSKDDPGVLSVTFKPVQ